jgi:hypothetical protein
MEARRDPEHLYKMAVAALDLRGAWCGACDGYGLMACSDGAFVRCLAYSERGHGRPLPKSWWGSSDFVDERDPDHELPSSQPVKE